MSKLSTFSFILYLLFFVNTTALAAEPGQKIATQGNGKGATACVACHGADGGGQAAAGFPRLAGLNATYLKKQLKNIADGSRKAPVMLAVAKALTEKEMEAVANYYSSLPVPPVKASQTRPDMLAQGEALAINGNWEKDIPACFACHGDGATGVGAYFPALAGQPASYITQQINAWKSGQRNNDPNQLMQGIAQRLSPDEIKAISAYLAGLASNQSGS